MELIDAHTHITSDDLKDYLEDVRRAKNAGVKRAMLVATEEKEVEQFKKLKNLDFFDMAYGLFPGDVDINYKERLKEIKQSHESFNFKALGEIGLDYHYEWVAKDLQKEAFIKQINLANKYNLPIVIHTREAVMDTLEILKYHKVNKYGVFHCCPLNRELVKEALKLGFYISFAGPITFKNSKNASEIIEMVPLDKMLIETDSPYLSPEPNRGKRNDSRNVKYTAQKIADVKNMSLEEIAKITYENANKIFKIE